jgi:hypothetical protein
VGLSEEEAKAMAIKYHIVNPAVISLCAALTHTVLPPQPPPPNPPPPPGCVCGSV